MIKSIILTSSLACFIFCISCVKQVGKPEPVATKTATPCDSITYSKSVSPIITGNCSVPACHVPGGSGLGDFTDFAQLKEKINNGTFKLRVFDSPNNPMPATGMLPKAQLDIIKCWLDNGAKND